MTKNNLFKLVFSILICQGVGIAGALWTAPNVDTWYAGLTKPSFTPPAWVFGPVWTLLYLMMAVSVWLIWTKGLHAPGVRKAVFLFCLQLVVNGCWSFLFFGIRSPLAGLINICLLWWLIGLTIILFYRIHKSAGMLLVPYGIWVGFALVLNFSLWQLNG